MLKIGVLLGLLTLIAAPAEGFAEDGADAFRDLTKNTELSCKTLVVLDYPKQDGEFTIANMVYPVASPVDVSDCQNKITATTFDKPLAPLIDLMKDDSTTATKGKLSESEREAKSKKEAEALVSLPQLVKVGLDPFVDYCRTIEPKVAPTMMRVCYFGGTASKTTGPAKALFEVMANNSVQEGPLCAPDPLKRGDKIEPEFQTFMHPNNNEMTWPDVRKSLSDNGFSCSMENQRDGCQRLVLAVHLEYASTFAVSKTNDNELLTYNPDFILIRQLFAYGGASPELEDSPPARGSKNGICVYNDEGVDIGYTNILLNGVTANTY
jgi:hypothetical protein